MLHLLTLAVAYVHVFLTPPDAISFAKRWKPQVAAGNVLSVSGLNRYTRACIKLHSDLCTGAVVQLANDGSSCMYVLHRNTTENKSDDVHMVSVLWQEEQHMLVHMRALRHWYDERFVDDLFGDRLQDEMDRDLWHLSGLEP